MQDSAPGAILLLVVSILLTSTPAPAGAADGGGVQRPAPAQQVNADRLQDETMALELPSADKLIPLGAKLPPIRLEASYTQPVSLREALTYAVDNNLTIRISQADLSSAKWLWFGSLGRFLPDAIMNYRQQRLAGTSLVGGVIPVTVRTPNVNTSAGYRYFAFQGGRVLFGTLSSLNNFKAARSGLQGTLNDVLLNVTRLYYTLMLNQALLQIQVRAVETSRAQLDLNQKLERAGVGTRFNVLQSETQLATDEQNLLSQEVALRNAAIQLAAVLNLNLGVNLLPLERDVRKVRLIDTSLDVSDLLRIAVANRPELKQYNYLRIAARRNIQVAAAPLYPTLQFFGTVTGSGATLGRSIIQSGGGRQTVPLNQLATATTNVDTIGPVFEAGQALVPSQALNRQVRKSTAIGFQVDWNYLSLGVPDMANVQSARALARKAMLQSNQQLLNVLQQVRTAYLNSQTAERQIDVATKQVVSSGEQLRLARVRLANGVGTNVDAILAQQDYTIALTNKVNAIIQFNIAQAQLLRDIGIISVDSITSGRLVRQ